MDFLTQLQNRYTTKMYNGEKLSNQTIETLKEVLRLSPSSINSQPWQFAFVGNDALMEKLAAASYFNKERVELASHLIVFTHLTPEALMKRFDGGSINEGSYAYFKENIFSKGEEYVQQWTAKQVYISLGVLLSACAAMGIDATPMEGINTQEYNRILGLSNVQTLVAVAIGKRHVDDKNQLHFKPKQRLSKEEIIKEYN